ncbi:hypothetical protein CKAN_02119200 [Cinnamomum micranthum f. kanehirae]|uniref:Uncharacterized protein n=1 Tax=Cinnamomum micranthum f. kanehirae TaxID=337451 RepID=A0A3S4PLH4_9MAGN|nr:hypothetical protein CKAN_02119200 [Cinnamomum micranthum f. kanehirae]
MYLRKREVQDCVRKMMELKGRKMEPEICKRTSNSAKDELRQQPSSLERAYGHSSGPGNCLARSKAEGPLALANKPFGTIRNFARSSEQAFWDYQKLRSLKQTSRDSFVHGDGNFESKTLCVDPFACEAKHEEDAVEPPVAQEWQPDDVI